jgi:hypothetical protein
MTAARKERGPALDPPALETDTSTTDQSDRLESTAVVGLRRDGLLIADLRSAYVGHSERWRRHYPRRAA